MEAFVVVVQFDRSSDRPTKPLAEAGISTVWAADTCVASVADTGIAVAVQRRIHASDTYFGPAGGILFIVQGWVEPMEKPSSTNTVYRLASDKVLPANVLLDRTAPAQLTGSFHIVAYDSDTHQLVVIVDRLASRPIFYYHDSKCLILSSDIRAILGVPSVDCSIDIESLVQFVRIQMILGGRTLYSHIRRLMPSTRLRFDLRASTIEAQRYWSMELLEPFDDSECAVSSLTTAFQAAGERIARGSERAGVLLSGGIDSRMTLAAIHPHLESFETFTFGPAMTDEGSAARLVAHSVGAGWHLVVQNAVDYWECLDFYLPALQGSYSMAHAHVAKTAKLMQELGVDTVYDGWGLDLPLSGSYLPKERFMVAGRPLYTFRMASLPTSEDARKWVLRSLDIQQGQFAGSFLCGWLRDVWDTATTDAVGRGIDGISEVWPEPYDQVEKFFASDFSVFRSYPVTSISRLFARQRNPLFDSGIMDCYLRLSVRQRFLGPTYRRALERIDPALARILYPNTGTSPFAPPIVQALVIQSRQFARANREQMRRMLGSMGLGHCLKRKLYGSYPSASELAQALISADVPSTVATREALMEGPLAQCGIIDVQRLRARVECGTFHDENESLTLLALASLAAWFERYPARIDL